SSPGGSVYVTDTTSVSSIFSSRLSYSKGAMVLHMLRWKMGDDIFFEALRNYLNDDKLKYSYAKTNDLIRHCEAVSGQDLSKFFDQWIYKEGYPSYSVEWNQKEDNTIDILINQTQSHASVDFFEMPIELGIKGIDDEKTFVRLDVNHNNFSKSISVDFKVSSIDFDPNKWLISKGNTVILNPELANDDYNLEQWTTIVREHSILLTTTNHSAKTLKIMLYDATGKRIISDQIKGTSNFSLKTGSIPKGVYYLIFDDGDRVVSKTILK
ncbi:MAG: peptidase M1, partial [Fusobacteria bacterium]